MAAIQTPMQPLELVREAKIFDILKGSSVRRLGASGVLAKDGLTTPPRQWITRAIVTLRLVLGDHGSHHLHKLGRPAPQLACRTDAGDRASRVMLLVLAGALQMSCQLPQPGGQTPAPSLAGANTRPVGGQAESPVAPELPATTRSTAKAIAPQGS